MTKVDRLNYSTHALDDMASFPVNPDPMTQAHLQNCRRYLTQAVKFQLPENGELLTDVAAMDPSLARMFRLPFPCVALEVPVTTGATQRLITLAVDLSLTKGLEWLQRHPGTATQFAHGGCLVTSINYVPHLAKWVPEAHSIAVAYAQDPAGSGLVREGQTRLGASLMGPFMTDAEEYVRRHGGWEQFQRRAISEHWLDLNGLMNLALCSLCSNVETETIAAPKFLSQQRVKKGKAPFFEYRVLTLKAEERQEGAPQGGTHASPRLHLRRGHIRRLSDGRMTWVRHAIVGDKTKGLIYKDYTVAK